MATAVKAAIIGAGSAVFSMKLVTDFCLFKSLSGTSVALMDIDEARLDAIHTVATRYASEVGANITFTKTTDRRQALAGADFVINTTLAGGQEGVQQEGLVSNRHGFFRHAPSMHTFRQFALSLDIARDMEALCPDAWLLQASNEVFDISTLVSRQTSIKVIGLCHGIYGYEDLAKELGLDLSEVHVEVPGVNHCIWMIQFRYRGRDAYPLIDEWLATKAEGFWKTYKPKGVNTQMSRTAFHLYKMYGLMPIGDTPRFTGIPRQTGWWYHTDLPTEQYWYGVGSGEAYDKNAKIEPHILRGQQRTEMVGQMAHDPNAKITEHFPAVPSRELHVPIIDALVNDNPGTFQVNVPNRGAIAGIADDVVVELPAVVSASGVQPLQIGAMPGNIMVQMLLPRILEMEQNLETFLSGRRSMLLYRVLMDHRTQSLTQAEAWLDEVLTLPHNRGLAARMSS